MKGFTLIEIVVAIFLLTVGTMGAFSLIQKTIAFTSISSSRLTATYLAQEGLEVVRNIRDTNYLEGSAWDDGLSGSCMNPRISPCDFYGDANFDGVVTEEDWTSVCGTDLCWRKQPLGESCARCDVNGDNTVNISDFALISAYLGNCSVTSFSICDTKAKFKREIIITPKTENKLEITAKVTWSERGNTHQVAAVTELDNWR